MKVTFDIDCTPEEARRFLGLPDVSAAQDRLIKEWEDKMREAMDKAVSGEDPAALMKLWNPFGADTIDGIQKAFWNSVGMSSGSSKSSKDD